MDNAQTMDRYMQLGELSNNILDFFLEGCQIISPELRYLYLNNAAATHGRIPRHQLIGHTMLEIYPGIENTPMFATLKKCLVERAYAKMENEFQYPDGSSGWFELSFEPVPEGLLILSIEISRRKQAEEEQRMILEALQLINAADDWKELLTSILGRLKEWSGCDAAAIRLRDGQDFPYFMTTGLTGQSITDDAPSSAALNYDDQPDGYGNPILEFLSGKLIDYSCYTSQYILTADGNFWSGGFTAFLANADETVRKIFTPYHNIGPGFESIALIPLNAGQETFGLIQLNDRRFNCFSPKMIAKLRRVADRIANFLARKKAENRVAHLNAVLRGIRNVNQLITREKNRDQLIQKACDLLVDARGFNSVVIGLTDSAGKKVLSHAESGIRQTSLLDMLDRGEVPQIARGAMTKRQISVQRGFGKKFMRVQPANEQEIIVINLAQDKTLYGFMLVCLPGEMIGDIEEQDLLKEVAGDLSFALRSIEIEIERNASEKALANVQEQFRQAQKLEAIGQLAGGIAHDFNNILMAQMGYCDLLKAGLRDEDPLAGDLAEIRAFAVRAAGLTRQLLAFSRKQTLQPEVLNLNTVISNIEKMLRRLIGEDIDFVTALATDLGSVKADPGQIEQVIMNLAVNARDAMPQGGKLTIETENIILDDEYALTHIDSSAGSHVMLAITDTGCGMDELTKARIFEPFFTTKEQGKGTGLGLATVYGIIKQSGGNIWVYSEPGEGTTFKIYLPSIEAEEVKQSRSVKKTMKGNGELVMVVEDEPALRNVFVRMIKNLGYRVETASNGSDALIAIEKNGVMPDILITDVVMPGMSGKMLVDHLRRLYPDIKVLYASGYTDKAIVNHGILDHDTPFLQKPFSIVDLANKIRDVLEGE